MVLKSRERTIAIVLAASLGLLVIDRYVYTPYMDWHDKVEEAEKKVTAQQQRADRLHKNRALVKQNWDQLLETGLKTDSSAAENQALHAMQDWARDARVDLQSLKPDRVGRTGDFQQIRLQATGVGSTAAFANLLHQIETAKIPMKISDLRLTSRKEGQDDLSFSLNVTTIVFSPAPEKASAVRTSAKGESR